MKDKYKRDILRKLEKKSGSYVQNYTGRALSRGTATGVFLVFARRGKARLETGLAKLNKWW